MLVKVATNSSPASSLHGMQLAAQLPPVNLAAACGTG